MLFHYLMRNRLRQITLLAFLLPVFAISAATVVTNLALGNWANHSLFLKSDGSLWGTGANGSGELGLPSDGWGFNRPQQIVASNVMAMACGTGHSLFIKSDGSLWGMGNNSQWLTALPEVAGTDEPVQVPLTNVIAIAAGMDHNLFLKSDGSLWAAGRDTMGQLGDGAFYFAEPSGPHEVELIVAGGVTAIAAGEQHSLFLKADGSLWAMGANYFGQLGDGLPEFIPYYPDPNAFTNLPEQIVASNVIAIAAGGAHTLFLKSDGSLWGMGWNRYGQLGTGNFSSTNRPTLIISSNVTAIAAGGFHSLFLKSDGSLWAMGRNVEGQLGDGTFGSDQDFLSNVNQPEQIVASNVTAIAAGEYHSMFLKSDGSLWATGHNYRGQLGDGFNDYGNMDHGVAVPEQIVPTPRPLLAQTISDGTNMQFDADCAFGGDFYLLTSPNLTRPPDQWMPVWTNVISDRHARHFSATLTNVMNAEGRQFYMLHAP